MTWMCTWGGLGHEHLQTWQWLTWLLNTWQEKMQGQGCNQYADNPGHGLRRQRTILLLHWHDNFKLIPPPIYRASQEECARLRESVPYVKLYRYNPKHLYPKLNGYGDNGQRSLKLWQLLHTYWLPNTY